MEIVVSCVGALLILGCFAYMIHYLGRTQYEPSPMEPSGETVETEVSDDADNADNVQ